MKLNKRIIIVMTSVCSLFLITVFYLTYFMLFQAKDIANSTFNQRIWEKEEKILRGDIVDRTGIVLAQSSDTENGQKRSYPYNELYAHTIGYSNRTYGKTGIELKYNDYLLKTESVLDSLKKKSKINTLQNGAKIELTLDHGMTALAAKEMRGASGSVVALNPKTGEVYCMYSNPTFNPNEKYLTENWDALSAQENSPFVNRSTQGRYAPGSTFKVVTGSAAIELGYGDFMINDEGNVIVGGHKFKNASEKSYGEITMKEAIKYSSNVFFASISKKIKRTSFQYIADEFYITKKIPFDLDINQSKLEFDDMDDAEIASTAIGQGKLQITPVNMALVACAVANDGVIMKPYMVSKAYFEKGDTLYRQKPSVLSKPIKSGTAKLMGEYMVECVNGGTGKGARVSGIQVAGKTGTAENEKKDKTHAWFICFAPADDPQIAICIMKEYSGGGGSSCSPIAAKLITYAKKSGLISN